MSLTITLLVKILLLQLGVFQGAMEQLTIMGWPPSN